MTKCIFNNQWCELEELTIPIQSDAVQFGTGLFETLRTYGNKQLPFLDKHLQRLFSSIVSLNLACDYSQSDIKTMVIRLVNEHDSALQRIKILVIPEGVLVTSVNLIEPLDAPYRLTHWRTRRGLPEHKSTSYLQCQLAWQMAQDAGFDDSILLDEEGHVYETGRANLFWVIDGQIFTREHDVLPGTMRDFVLTNANVQFSHITYEDLLTADEVFITNSIRGIAFVSTIDSHNYQLSDVATSLQSELRAFTQT